jgi:hypothetical protein
MFNESSLNVHWMFTECWDSQLSPLRSPSNLTGICPFFREKKGLRNIYEGCYGFYGFYFPESRWISRR